MWFRRPNPLSLVVITSAPQPRPAFAGIVLAAGASGRLRRPKQLVEIDGSPLVARAADALIAAGAKAVHVVLGANAAGIRSALAGRKIAFVDNPDWSRGMATSIRAGVAAAAAHPDPVDAVVIALCDQPAFSRQVVDQLVDALAGSGKTIAAARYAGRLGVPAVFLRQHFAMLASLEGDSGARRILNAHPEAVAAVDLPALERDIDTPSDLGRGS